MRSVLAVLVRKLLSLPRRGYRSFVVSLVLGCSLSWTNPLVAELHARWAPDFTVSPPQWQCVTGGTVAGPVEFQLIVGYKNNETIPFVYCNYIELTEQTSVHTPQTFRVDNPTGTYVSPSQISSYCSSPPPNCDIYIVFSAPPSWGFACHNTSYRAKASYTYKQNPYGQPPPAQTVEVSITVNFNNLIVSSQPMYLVNNPRLGANHNLKITFQLDSAQKKHCTATISIYNAEGGLVKQETLNNLLCPGTHTYIWDGKGNQMPFTGRVLSGGIYPYDIVVQGLSPYDSDRLCSGYLKIVNTKMEFLDTDLVKVSYVLEDSSGREASSVEVRLYIPSWSCTTAYGGTLTNLPGTINPIWNSVEFSVSLDEIGTYRGLVLPKDNHADKYKNHLPKPALPRNSSQNSLLAGVVIDPGHGGNDGGCTSRSGVAEKAFNLPQAEKIGEALLQHKDRSSPYGIHSNPSQRFIEYKVKLTRQEDMALSLKDRAKQAKTLLDEIKAIIEGKKKEGQEVRYLGIAFVSIHHDSAGENVRQTLVIRRDNLGGSDNLSAKIRAQVAQITTKQERQYNERLTQERMGLIKILREEFKLTTIPAVLLEVTNIKNEYDEGLASSNENFRLNFANRTHRGIDDFFVSNYIPGYGPEP